MFLCILLHDVCEVYGHKTTTFLHGAFSTLAEAQTAMLKYYNSIDDKEKDSYHDVIHGESVYMATDELYILEITLGNDTRPNYTKFTPPPLSIRYDE